MDISPCFFTTNHSTRWMDFICFPIATPSGIDDDFGIVGQMNPKELMLLSNLEHTRAGLISTWKHVEAEKKKILKEAKDRINRE